MQCLASDKHHGLAEMSRHALAASTPHWVAAWLERFTGLVCGQSSMVWEANCLQQQQAMQTKLPACLSGCGLLLISMCVAVTCYHIPATAGHC